jgi:nitroimidazol reductase NimA-like FMN-containing flavoprotein (pyridoxamine 5'-phosphate oxidase superfamily)/GNAT superfamily N-acetyltransferase
MDRPSESRELAVTPRTTLKRHAERGSHDRSVVEAILDEALVCHVATVVDGSPRVLPTMHVRVGGNVYLHGARANRLFGEIARGAPVCLTATLVDGIVFARTWFHHSMNFRSAVLYGTGVEVTDTDEKRAALAALVDRAAPGRSREAVPPTEAELRSTLVVRLPILEGSAKVRAGGPLDGPELFDLPVWAGELPLRLTAVAPRNDVNLREGAVPSQSVSARAGALGAPDALEAEPFERRRGDVTVDTDRGRLDFGVVHRFIAEESYWARGISADAQRLAMDRSLCFGLYRETEQIGFARVVTDLGRIAYLADVFVLAPERRKGLGKWLVEQVLAHPALARVDKWLLGTADAHALYEPFGFRRADAGRYMVRSVVPR